MGPVVVIPDVISRMGFRLRRDVLRATIPSGTPGTYCLVADDEPIYVGRSDNCVLTRLLGHPLADEATHFIWEPSRGPWDAFRLESFWWHRMEHFGSLRNAIHPARPAGTTRRCPFCQPRDASGLLRILPWLGGASVAAPRWLNNPNTTCQPS